jgi:hypothetical protein
MNFYGCFSIFSDGDQSGAKYGSIFGQSMAFGIIQIIIRFTINFVIVMAAAKIASSLTKNPLWVKAQK